MSNVPSARVSPVLVAAKSWGIATAANGPVALDDVRMAAPATGLPVASLTVPITSPQRLGSGLASRVMACAVVLPAVTVTVIGVACGPADVGLALPPRTAAESV